MQKFLIFPVVLLMAALSVHSAQAQTPTASTKPQTPEQAELVRLNKEMLDTYKAANYDEALKSGQQALSSSSRLYGEESRETASVLFNLGAVYRAKKQHTIAKDSFQKSLAVYQKHFPQGSPKITAIYNELGLISYDKKEFKEAEQWFLKALELSEKLNGVKNKETIAYVSSLALIYQISKDHEKAEAYYWRAREDANKALGAESAEYETYSDNYQCYTFLENDRLKDVLAKRKAEKKFLPGRGKLLTAKPAHWSSPVTRGAPGREA